MSRRLSDEQRDLAQLTDDERDRLTAVRRRLDEHLAKEKALRIEMGLVASEIYDQRQEIAAGRGVHYVKGISSQIVDALDVSRNQLYRMMERARLAQLEQAEEARSTRRKSAKAGSGPQFLPPGQQGSP